LLGALAEFINSRQQGNGSERDSGTGLPEIGCALRLKHALTRDRGAFRKPRKTWKASLSCSEKIGKAPKASKAS